MSTQINLKLCGNNPLRFVSRKTRMLTNHNGFFREWRRIDNLLRTDCSSWVSFEGLNIFPHSYNTEDIITFSSESDSDLTSRPDQSRLYGVYPADCNIKSGTMYVYNQYFKQKAGTMVMFSSDQWNRWKHILL